MSAVSKLAALAAISAVLSACSQQAGPSTLAVTVASLSSDISKACYTVETKSPAGNTLWSRQICSDQFGNGPGGGATYVGPCDSKASGLSTVNVSLDELYDPAGALIPAADYSNPCPPGSPCSQQFQCKRSADASVQFNLTVLLKAHVGFVDIGVSLDTISCGAKIDCPQNMTLTDPATGNEVRAAVLAIACSADSSVALHQYLTNVGLDCYDSAGNRRLITGVDSGAGPGNIYGGQSQAPEGIAQAATYRSVSTVVTEQGSTDTLSWSVAVAPDLGDLGKLDLTRCILHARATAADHLFESGANGGYLTPANQSYPFVDFQVQIVGTNPQLDGLATFCGENPLGGDGSGVQVQTTKDGSREAFQHYQRKLILRPE